MANGFGRGLRFRGCSPATPFIGRGRGGLPRCRAPFSYYSVGPKEEVSTLRNQARTLRQWLEGVERRIKDLEDEDEERK